jgi:hypothetical protein
MPVGRPVEARSSFFISPYDLRLALTGEAFSLLRTLRHAPLRLISSRLRTITAGTTVKPTAIEAASRWRP